MWKLKLKKLRQFAPAIETLKTRYSTSDVPQGANTINLIQTPPRSHAKPPSLDKPFAPFNDEMNVDPQPPARDMYIKPEDLEPIPETEEIRKASSFEDVPGPLVLKYISKAWSVVPVLGNQVTASTLQYILSAGKMFGSQLSWGNNLGFFRYLLDEYGPVVRLYGPFGGDVVILSRPEHAAVVFQNEGPYPIRSSLDCVEKYRLQHRKFRQAGPYVMHGPEWEKLRNAIRPALQESANLQYKRIAQTSDDFIKRILSIRNVQREVPGNFNKEINKWCMECLCSIMFNRKIGFLDVRGLSSTSEMAILLDSLEEATSAIRKCEFGFHVWKFYETPAWKKLVTNCDNIDHILSSYLRKTQEMLRERKDNAAGSADWWKTNPDDISLIECFLIKDSMLAEDILTVLLDMMLIGVNMTSHSVAFLLYHLARNPRAQYMLHEEIKSFPDNLTKEDVKKMKYLRACLHESLRLKPPMPVLSRILTKDITVHGFKIPRGTFMLIATNLSSLREESFEDPLKFKPERWLSGGLETNKDMEALATIPFGHGPKACLAKDLAEVQISMLLIRLLQKFRIEYNYGDIQSTNKLLAAPSRPLKFRFVDRY